MNRKSDVKVDAEIVLKQYGSKVPDDDLQYMNQYNIAENTCKEVFANSNLCIRFNRMNCMDKHYNCSDDEKQILMYSIDYMNYKSCDKYMNLYLKKLYMENYNIYRMIQQSICFRKIR